MGTKILFFTCISIAGFLLLSCEERLYTISDTIDIPPNNNALINQKEDYETMYMMQTNPELILADRIISKEAGYVLDISKEEASELHISDELYKRFLNKVNKLNNIKNKIYE